jgi:hypothetical protein
VEVRWADSLFSEVPPLTSDVLITTLHPLFGNGVAVVLKEPFLRWRSNFSGESALRIEKWKWMHPQRSVEPCYNIHHTVQISHHAISGFFEPWKGSSEIKTACTTILLKLVASRLHHVSEKCVERCKKCIAAKGGTSKKRPSPHLHEVPTRSNESTNFVNGPRIYSPDSRCNC